jgi:site-specific DNA recombinase
MNPTLRCATYARYSSSQQRDASIVDQQRNMMRYAETKGWRILTDYMFSDEAISGAGLDRPGFQKLLRAADADPRVIDVILVDDTSRISRSLADTVRLREDLNFKGIRFVAVSQGIDSDDEQADVMMTVHGLVDSLYIKELAKKTHRGLEGLALSGFHTGGSCFGYTSEKMEDGRSRLEIVADEAAVVVRIFTMSSSGMSLKKIAKQLNDDGVPPPRGTKQKTRSSWVYTAIREMLRRDLYRGRIVWNKRKFKKRPGTNKRISVLRPECDWVTREEPTLRIVDEELWTKVQSRLADVAQLHPGMKPGLQSRAASVPYLFSGILKCGTCGANLSILTGRGKSHRDAKYGCPHHMNRGVCSNDLLYSRNDIERHLLSGLQDCLLDDSAVEYVMAEVAKALDAAKTDQPEQMAQLRKSQAGLEKEMENLADAIGKSGGSAFLMKTLQMKETELSSVTARLARYSPRVLGVGDRKWLKDRVLEGIGNLTELLSADPFLAKAELRTHVESIRMTPAEESGKRFYVAEGEWNLLGNGSVRSGQPVDVGDLHFRMVAGVGFEPTTFGL